MEEVVGNPELVGRAKAAQILGVAYGSVFNWENDGTLTATHDSEGRAFFAKSELEKIRALRSKYGNSWKRHLDENGPAPASTPAQLQPPAARVIPLKAKERAEGVDFKPCKLVPASEGPPAEFLMCKRMVGRARKLESEGKLEAAIAVLWTVIEEVFEPTNGGHHVESNLDEREKAVPQTKVQGHI